MEDNPYASPKTDSPPHPTPQVGVFDGVSWGFLFGAVNGATYGALGMVVAALVRTLALTMRGQEDLQLIDMVMQYLLSAIVGGVWGTVAGAILGVLGGLFASAMPARAARFASSCLFGVVLSSLALAMLSTELKLALDGGWPILEIGGTCGIVALGVLGGRRTALSLEAVAQKDSTSGATPAARMTDGDIDAAE